MIGLKGLSLPAERGILCLYVLWRQYAAHNGYSNERVRDVCATLAVKTASKKALPLMALAIKALTFVASWLYFFETENLKMHVYLCNV